MLEKIKNNKLVLGFLALFYIVLVYCHFQTFVISDDLPYSLFYRGENRIINIDQILHNQYSDYFNISARAFIHCIVQFLLIYEKDLWSILNPLVIISIIVLMTYLIKCFTKTKINNLFIVLGCCVAFLLLYDYKYLVYWVAGSVNYTWVFLLILLFMIYYLKIGLENKPIITALLCLIFSLICESLAIFVICVVVFNYIIKKINKQKNLNKKYLLFIICCLIGFSFILFSPATLNRMSGNEITESLSFIEKIFIAIPVLSIKIFKISIYNIFPVLLIVSSIIYGKSCQNKKIIYFSFVIIIMYIMAFIVNSGWIFFIIGILCFILQSYIIYTNKDLKLWPILIAGYAVSYSLIITPEYGAGRTNFYFFLILSMFIMYNIFIKLNKFNSLKFIILFLAVLTIIFEIVIYYNIGNAKYEREKSIENVMKKNTDVLELKLIKRPFSKFHIDANYPSDKEYWAYKHYEDYYNLPSDIKIKTVK